MAQKMIFNYNKADSERPGSNSDNMAVKKQQMKSFMSTKATRHLLCSRVTKTATINYITKSKKDATYMARSKKNFPIKLIHSTISSISA